MPNGLRMMMISLLVLCWLEIGPLKWLTKCLKQQKRENDSNLVGHQPKIKIQDPDPISTRKGSKWRNKDGFLLVMLRQKEYHGIELTMRR